MSEINELIREKLKAYPADVYSLAIKAIKLSEQGLPKTTIAENLNALVRQIIKKKES